MSQSKIYAVDCETCKLRTGMETRGIRPRLPLPEGHFNPSMIEWKGKVILATRDSWGHSKLALWELKNEKDDWSGKWLTTPLGSSASLHPDAPRLEDPRLFIGFTADGEPRLHAMVNLPDGYPPKRVQVGYVRFTADLSAIDHTEIYKSPNNNLYEKNWVPFYVGNDLYWVYSTKPEHIVMGEKTVYRTQNHLPWVGGVIRGGAAPVRVVVDRFNPKLKGCNGEESYYHFFHGCLKRFQGSVYTVGCAVFESQPPFRILRQTVKPLVWPDLPGSDETVVKRYVMWPGGVIPHAGHWHLALGIDDTNCRIVRLPYGVVESELKDVPEQRAAASIRDTPLAKGIPATEV